MTEAADLIKQALEMVRDRDVRQMLNCALARIAVLQQKGFE